jgi:regulator of sigma E protease
VISIIGFLIMLAPLVIVHEMGHFLFAKLFNVKAEAFSIGFGPRIFKKQIGETEWRVSLIPLGGYVKLLGEDPEAPLSPADKARSLNAQAPWKRFFIFFGGPLFNFLWAILVYAAILAIGEPQMSAQVGRVIPDSPAAKHGFISGDIIQSIDGAPVKTFEEVANKIDAKPNQKLTFAVLRNDPFTGEKSSLELQAEATHKQGFSVYGEETMVGDIDGILPAGRAGTIGISSPTSEAAKAGFKSGDVVTQLFGKAVKSWEDVDAIYARIPSGSSFNVEVASKTQVTWTKPKNSTGGIGADFGLYSSEMFIEKTVPKSPAETAGIKTGDRMVSIAGTPVNHFFALRETVQKSAENSAQKSKLIELAWERDGKIMKAEVEPTATGNRDALLNKTTQYTIGVMPALNWAEPTMVVERIYNPLVLLTKGTEKMLTFTYRNFVSIKKMFTGDVSMATLGGPILIGKIAGESLSRGLIAFLGTMAILSIGLGVLNILPVPVLDGGHILLLIIESIRGKPLSLKQLEVVQTMGLSLIALLMFVVLKNDITRLPFFN